MTHTIFSTLKSAQLKTKEKFSFLFTSVLPKMDIF